METGVPHWSSVRPDSQWHKRPSHGTYSKYSSDLPLKTPKPRVLHGQCGVIESISLFKHRQDVGIRIDDVCLVVLAEHAMALLADFAHR